MATSETRETRRRSPIRRCPRRLDNPPIAVKVAGWLEDTARERFGSDYVELPPLVAEALRQEAGMRFRTPNGSIRGGESGVVYVDSATRRLVDAKNAVIIEENGEEYVFDFATLADGAMHGIWFNPLTSMRLPRGYARELAHTLNIEPPWWAK